eukprot:scaffold107485_cov33-Phaeocystis_antarctica.AAC.1
MGLQRAQACLHGGDTGDTRLRCEGLLAHGTCTAHARASAVKAGGRARRVLTGFRVRRRGGGE